MFFTYRQNNSGGSFNIDSEAGISIFVVVEADSADDADRRAVDIGLYFDGCETGEDCECCGDRWSRAYEGYDVPSEYGKPIADLLDDKRRVHWEGSNPMAYIHYKNGEILAVGGQS
ncbi:MAG TPA: hypothetical protein VFM34_11950 [Moraxellaceae bacterium]|nr:hypothetical protein [Moraxellaceae bacterium]